MRPTTDISAVQALVAEGRTDREIARRTGNPCSTIGHWRRGERRARVTHSGPGCERCGHAEHDFAALPGAAYAYLLGAYLGDGHITRHRRGVLRLTIFCDASHRDIATSIAGAMTAVLPGTDAAITPHRHARLLRISRYSKQWACLFPQHGPGRKHERRIELAAWQRRIAEAHAEDLLRGLIDSDGSRFLNRVCRGERFYEYPRYQFTNVSPEIRRVFTDACDILGIEWRPTTAFVISVARRDSVARLDGFVGPKS